MWYIGFCYKCEKPVAFKQGQKTVLCRRCFKKLECGKLLKRKIIKAKSGMDAAVIIQRICEGKLKIS
jgi:hypothetical protein